MFLLVILVDSLFIESHLLNYVVVNLEIPLCQLFDLLLVLLSSLHLLLRPIDSSRVQQNLVKLSHHLLVQSHKQRLLRYLLLHSVHCSKRIFKKRGRFTFVDERNVLLPYDTG